MKNSIKTILITLTAAAMLTACNEEENDIPVSEVPPNVISAVQSALPGIVLEEAEKCSKHDEPTYKLEGKLINGKEYDIKITESGTIIKIELDD
jgi:uncharacterized lipoprotein YajG